LNAIEQGGRFDPGQNVEIACLRARHMVICRVKDPGPGVSQEAILNTAMANRPDAPIRHNAYREAQGLHPGGYGVLIARHFVDDLIYDEKGNMSGS
jgi:anti-sigma regulatory factor (Ser/Thr protein kinase)